MVEFMPPVGFIIKVPKYAHSIFGALGTFDICLFCVYASQPGDEPLVDAFFGLVW